MANLADLLLRIRGDSSDAQKDVGTLAGLIKAFGSLESTAEIDVDTGEAQAELVALRTTLESLQDETVNVDLHTSKAESQIAKLGKQLSLLGDESPDINAGGGRGNVEQEGAQTRLSDADETQRLSDLRTNVAAAFTDIRGELLETDKQFQQVDSRIAKFATQGDGNLARVTRAILRFRRTKAEVELDLKDESFLGKMFAIERGLDALRGTSVDVDVDVDRQGSASRATSGLTAAFSRLTAGGNRVTEGVRNVSSSMGPFSVQMTKGVLAVAGLAVSIGVGLLGALSALGVTAVGAAGAVGLLAGALATSLAPAVALGIATFSRFGKIMEAGKAQEQAKASATQRSAQASQSAAQAAEQRRSAELAVGEALRSVEQAESGVQDARSQAADDIAQAVKAQVAAARSLSEANADLQKTTQEAYRAISDSAEKVTDALLSVEDARLGIDEAALGVREAEAALADLRTESGASAGALNDVFSKFTDVDVDFDPSKLIAGLETAGVDQTDQQLEIERAILRVRRAKLSEKQANDGLSDSERALADARAENLKFQRQGISAFAPYTSAVAAQQNAIRSLNEATAEANELQRAGIGGAPGVVSALQAVEDAERRLAEARRARTMVQSQAGLMPDDADKAQELLAQLTGAERAFLAVLTRVKAQMRTIFQPATDAIFMGLTKVLSMAPALFAPLQRSFLVLGQSIAGAMTHVMKSLIQPDMIAKFNLIILGAARLAAILGGPAFAAFLRIMTNLAVAAMPYLIAGANRFAAAMQRWSTGIFSVQGFQRILAALMPMLGSMARLFGAIGAVGLAFFRAVSPIATIFTNQLAMMVQKLADFLNTKEGQELVKKFFTDMSKFAAAVLPFIFQLVIFFGQLFQAAAPALTVIFNTLTFILGIVNKVVAAFMPLLQVLILIGTYILGGFIGGIVKLITRVSVLAAVFPKTFGKIRKIVGDVVGFVTKMFGGLVNILTWPFRKFLGFLDGIGGKIVGGAKKIITWIIEGIKSAPGAIYGALKKALGPVGNLLPGSEPKDKSSPLTRLDKAGKAILTNMISGVPQGGKELSVALHRQLVPVVGNLQTAVASPKSLPAQGGAGPGTVIERQDVNIPSAPGYEGMGDPTTQALKFARELRRRGRGRGL